MLFFIVPLCQARNVLRGAIGEYALRLISTDFGDEPEWVINVLQTSTDKCSVCIYARVLVLIEA